MAVLAWGIAGFVGSSMGVGGGLGVSTMLTCHGVGRSRSRTMRSPHSLWACRIPVTFATGEVILKVFPSADICQPASRAKSVTSK